MRPPVHPDHQRIEELNHTYGVQWKGPDYGKGSWEFSPHFQSCLDHAATAVRALSRADDPDFLLNLALKAALFINSPSEANVGVLADEMVLEEKFHRIQTGRKRLLDRERTRSAGLLKQYRAQHGIKLLPLAQVRTEGFKVDEPNENEIWTHSDGRRALKVLGYTKPSMPGNPIEDAYDGPFDGNHTPDSIFMMLSAGDARDPGEVWSDYRRFETALENEIAGDVDTLLREKQV